DVDAGEPVHHALEALEDIVEVEILPLDGAESRAHLLAANLVAAAVDRVQQTLSEIGARSEELHLFADAHGRNAAGDSAVVSPGAAHHLVTFELNRAGVDRHFRREVPERLRQARRVPDGEVRLRRRTQVVERLEETEAGFGNQS